MKKQPDRPHMKETRLLAIVLSLVAVMLGLLGSASLTWLPLPLQLIGPLLLGGIIFLLSEAAMRAENEESPAVQATAKVLTVLVVASIAICIATAVKALSVDLRAGYTVNRAAYENVATAAGFAAILITFLLSALQKDIYWISNRNGTELDERQLKQRQEVFETSYKIGTYTVVVAAWCFIQFIDLIPTMMAYKYNGSDIPGHVYWLPLCLVIFLFALPLIVASWYKNKKSIGSVLRLLFPF